MKRATYSLLAITLSLAACSSDAPPPTQSAAEIHAAAEKTVVGDQIKALDRAKAVQEVIDQQKADADKKLEDAGG